MLLENKVFDRLAHLAPALVIQSSVSYFLVDFQDFIPFIVRMTQAYMIIIGLSVIISIVHGF